MAWGRVRTGRSLDRLLNFADAVVAVAITLLALTLVDIEGPRDGQSMLDVLQANLGQIQAFVITFFVVGLMWNVRNRIVNHLAAYDSATFWLILLWLLGASSCHGPVASTRACPSTRRSRAVVR